MNAGLTRSIACSGFIIGGGSSQLLTSSVRIQARESVRGRLSTRPASAFLSSGINRTHKMASDQATVLAGEFGNRATGGGSRGGGRGGRFRARGGGGGGGGGKGREVDVSRALSRLLRHQAAAAGVALDAEGFASLEKVVSD